MLLSLHIFNSPVLFRVHNAFSWQKFAKDHFFSNCLTPSYFPIRILISKFFFILQTPVSKYFSAIYSFSSSPHPNILNLSHQILYILETVLSKTFFLHNSLQGIPFSPTAYLCKWPAVIVYMIYKLKKYGGLCCGKLLKFNCRKDEKLYFELVCNLVTILIMVPVLDNLVRKDVDSSSDLFIFFIKLPLTNVLDL